MNMFFKMKISDIMSLIGRCVKMKKVVISIVAIIMVLGLTGCNLFNKSKNSIEIISTDGTNEVEDKTKKAPGEAEEESFKEGKYRDVSAQSDEPHEGEDSEVILDLVNGFASKYDTYFGITTEGTYTVDGTNITITYTRSYGTTTYGEPFDDAINDTYQGHVEGNRIIIDSISGFDGYEPGSVVYELM